eukprot:306914-Chlamydomonas_euryale.AAC.1
MARSGAVYCQPWLVGAQCTASNTQRGRAVARKANEMNLHKNGCQRHHPQPLPSHSHRQRRRRDAKWLSFKPAAAQTFGAAAAAWHNGSAALASRPAWEPSPPYRVCPHPERRHTAYQTSCARLSQRALVLCPFGALPRWRFAPLALCPVGALPRWPVSLSAQQCAACRARPPPSVNSLCTHRTIPRRMLMPRLAANEQQRRQSSAARAAAAASAHAPRSPAPHVDARTDDLVHQQQLAAHERRAMQHLLLDRVVVVDTGQHRVERLARFDIKAHHGPLVELLLHPDDRLLRLVARVLGEDLREAEQRLCKRLDAELGAPRQRLLGDRPQVVREPDLERAGARHDAAVVERVGDGAQAVAHSVLDLEGREERGGRGGSGRWTCGQTHLHTPGNTPTPTLTH